jgi:uncharacterized protein (DUF427 family)
VPKRRHGRHFGPTTPTWPTTSSSGSTRSSGARRTCRSSANPHDPFGRIDVLQSSRHVRVEHDGVLLAESSRPMLLFETLLPVRFYLPREDVAVELESSDTSSYCAYKGRASYFSVPDGPRDVAWTYREPLHDAEQVRDRICFFDERLDVIVDGERRDRPATPWTD